MTSISTLIYRSVAYCDHIYESLHRYTPQLNNGEAEFYFMAVDPTRELLDHMRNKGYRRYVQNNTHFTEDELKVKGLGWPEYSNRVYRSQNRVWSEARGKDVVFLSSDMSMSPGWLDGLLRLQDGRTIVTSQLVEPMGADIPHGSILKDFGTSPAEFREDEFLSFADLIRTTGKRDGGQYVPVCIPSKLFHEGGGFSEGNIDMEWAGSPQYPADVALHDRYAKLGIPHVTALDSIVYHFFRGELREGGYVHK